MAGLCEINMSFEECLDDAKSRLIMVAFVKFNDEDYENLMATLQEISKDYRRLVILAVDATRNIQLARDFNVTACPTFLFFRNRTLEECLSLLRSHTKQLVVFIFYAEWCPHSKELKPFLEALVKDDQNVIIVLINVDDAEDVIPFYSLYAVPSFYFFKNQAEIGTHVGGDITKLRGFIRKYKRIKETE
ncbi:unnamed protein product [Mesocestoides corti]|uniref:Thioredoxin domain-containing protein n=1 Tax=Mesocestoides corti TaxID=53468 RepID=A0A0R3U4J1_MESCO|nr:unnamed protein product [Mesocestoides corti]